MKKRNLLKAFILVIACILLTGCGRSAWIASTDKEDRENIAYVSEILTHIINSHDDKALYELFDDEFKNDDLYRQISRFSDSHGDIKEAYVDFVGYSSERLSHTPYISYSAVDIWMVANDNIYLICLNFNITKENAIDITRLWISSAKTEAKENENWPEKYHFSHDAIFMYADYYDDDYSGEYKMIWGEVLSWDPTASYISAEDIDEEKWVGAPINDFIEQYGRPGAELKEGETGYHILFYGDTDEKYVQIFLNEDDTIRRIRSVDKIKQGHTGIEEIQIR